jgi:hypothetical protein
MDPIQGVEQTQESFWKRIHAYFHQHRKFESNRTEGSLMNRWSGIQHDVNLFCGYLSKGPRRGENSEFGSDHNDIRPTTILCSAPARDSCKTMQYVGVYA